MKNKEIKIKISGAHPGSTENKDISFHRLPTTKRDEIKKKWVQNIKRKVVSSTLYICSEAYLL